MQEPPNLLQPDAGVMLATLIVVGLLLAVPIYFLVRFLRAFNRRSQRAVAVEAHVATIAALESEVAELRTQVSQLTEAQDFTTQLMQARASDENAKGASPP